jgi:phage N-6-adenine-methyltransferase
MDTSIEGTNLVLANATMPTYAGPDALARLRRCVAVMRKGAEDIWTAAREIRDDRLWRAATDSDGRALYTSWSDFLEKEFGCRETTGNRLIIHADTSAKIREALPDTPIGVLPEGVTREIPTTATAQQAGAVYKEALAIEAKPTAKTIAAIVTKQVAAGVLPRPKTRRHAQRKLQEKARSQLNPSPLNAWSGHTANGPSLLVARSDSADVLFGLSTGSGTGQMPGLDLRKRYRDLFGTDHCHFRFRRRRDHLSARCRGEAMMAQPDAWETPPEVFDPLNTEFGPFTLDPCCYPHTAKAPVFYTKSEDGIAQSWAGHRVWLNPPYTKIQRWLWKSHVQSQRHNALVVALIPNATDTGWWHSYVEGFAEIRFLKGRVNFFLNGRPAGPHRFGSVVAIYRPSRKLNNHFR